MKSLILPHGLNTPGCDVQLQCFPQFPVSFNVQDEFDFGHKGGMLKQTLV